MYQQQHQWGWQQEAQMQAQLQEPPPAVLATHEQQQQQQQQQQQHFDDHQQDQQYLTHHFQELPAGIPPPYIDTPELLQRLENVHHAKNCQSIKSNMDPNKVNPSFYARASFDIPT